MKRISLLLFALLLCSQVAFAPIPPMGQIDFYGDQTGLKLKCPPSGNGDQLKGVVVDPARLGIPGVTKGTPVTVVFKSASEAKLTVKDKTFTHVLINQKWKMKK